MKKELLLSGLLAIAGCGAVQTESIEQIPVQEHCTALVITTPLAKGGITLPRLPNGDSIIFMRNRDMIKHELGHSEQVCEQGIVDFTRGYIADPMSYERDADLRAKLTP